MTGSPLSPQPPSTKLETKFSIKQLLVFTALLTIPIKPCPTILGISDIAKLKAQEETSIALFIKLVLANLPDSDQKYLVLKEINGNFSSGAQLAENINALMEDVNLAAKALWNCKKPVIAAVDGVCAGAGANMILLSDFIIATSTTRFIEVFARRGLVVDFGGSWNLPRIIGLQKAKELMMTTKEIDGESMNNLGMLYKLTQKENLDSELSDLIDLLNEQSFISICMIKDQIDRKSVV